jgi:hypothetical protein
MHKLPLLFFDEFRTSLSIFRLGKKIIFTIGFSIVIRRWLRYHYYHNNLTKEHFPPTASPTHSQRPKPERISNNNKFILSHKHNWISSFSLLTCINSSQNKMAMLWSNNPMKNNFITRILKTEPLSS